MNYIKNYSITFNASSLEFQSTPSVGRATNGSTFEPPLFHDFNPRPPWGGRRFTTLAKTWDLSFQSPPSGGRATPDLSAIALPSSDISIHALRGEGDARRSYHGNDNYNFNPRPPWGGRLLGFFMRTRLKIFQSTPSVGRATQNKIIASFTRPKFQSTPSVGRATKRKQPNQSSTDISIHALRGEGDCPDWQHTDPQIYFNPRPPWGGRHSRFCGVVRYPIFQSTPSVGRAT